MVKLRKICRNFFWNKLVKTYDEFVKVSGILYRFRVTAVTAEGGVSFPSDPSEPFVIDIPGVQVQSNSFVYLKNELNIYHSILLDYQISFISIK